MKRHACSLGLVIAATAGGVIGSGCSQPVRVISAVHGLPRYSPAESQLFNDSFSPWLVGVPGEDREPARDPKLIERTQRADSVLRAKVATLSDAPGSGYLLDARAVSRLAGTTPPSPIALRIADGTAASTLVARHRHRLIGKNVVLFLRRYNDRGSPKTHWYASVDTQAVVEAVERARQN